MTAVIPSATYRGSTMIELDDIQGLIVHRRRHGFARYLFLRIGSADQGRRWLDAIAGKLTTARPVAEIPPASVNVALTHDGLAALGLAADSLASFPEEFRAGMPARSALLGDTGDSAPEHWTGGLATPDLHAMLLLFARDEAARDEVTRDHRAILSRFGDITELSVQDTERIPGNKEHFGYREGITDVVIEGSGIVPPPGHEPPVKAGEFVLGYPDETLELPEMPHPAALGRNASYLVYRKLYQDVAGFRRVLSREAHDPAEVELLAAKLMGRWRSGAPLVLAPQRDDAALAADAHRNNDFTYGADSHGLACPIGSHIRRSHPRDTLSPTERNRHRVIRRGLPYGPVLPEGAPDDGVDRGLAAMIGAASISRQFEFVQHTWINNRKFQGLENDKDPITGDHDGTTDMTLPRKPFHKRIVGFPRFVTVRGGGYFFLPGISGVRYLAG